MGTNRPTRHQSIWWGTEPAPALQERALDHVADVVVVGGGITGLTTALMLQRAGAQVVLIDRHRLAGGTTGGTTAKVTALHGATYARIADRHGRQAAQAYAAANAAGVRMIEALCAAEGIACDLQHLSAVIHAGTPRGRRLLEREVRAATDAGLSLRSGQSPTGAPGNGGESGAQDWAALDEQLAFHPRRYCLGLAAAFRTAGGTIVEGLPVTATEGDHDTRTVMTPAGRVRTDHVVVATLLPFPMAGHFFAKTRPSRSYALAATAVAGAVPDAMYLGLDQPRRSVRPHIDADGRSWSVVEGESHVPGDEPDTAGRYAALQQWTHEHLPVEHITWAWSAQDYMPVDDMPFVGPIDRDDDRVLVATGFGKWGMSNGTAAALMLADRITGRHNEWAEFFDSTRSVAVHAPGAAMAANAEVARDFASTRLGRLGARHADDLAPGEGDVVHTDDGIRAVFRDDAGDLHAVPPNCTHMGCGLRFNNAERTWDCPCHGSRFTTDGEVIEGPATQPLVTRVHQKG